MPATFHIAPRFHPAYSLLGRRLQRRVGAMWRAEALYLVVLTGLLLAWLLGAYAGGALLQPQPGTRLHTLWWGTQAGTLLLLGLTCVVGIQPGVTVTGRPGSLTLARGRRTQLRLAWEDVHACETISALTLHRHYRRYAATRLFVNRLEAELLLLHTAHGPVVVGLTPPDRAALLHLLARRIEARTTA